MTKNKKQVEPQLTRSEEVMMNRYGYKNREELESSFIVPEEKRGQVPTSRKYINNSHKSYNCRTGQYE